MPKPFQRAGRRNIATLHIRQSSQAMEDAGRLAEPEGAVEGVGLRVGMAYLVGR
jgi:hypothetical protein